VIDITVEAELSPKGDRNVTPDAPNYGEQIRAAEVIAALSLATDLGIGVPLEHGLQSTLIAMRLGEQLGVDAETASQAYFSCLLFYVGCTANGDIAAEVFGAHNALTTYGAPVRFGARRAAGARLPDQGSGRRAPDLG
jgi:hypothetical protein